MTMNTIASKTLLSPSPQKHFWIVVICLGALNAAGIFFLIRPLILSIIHAHTDTANATAKITALDSERAHFLGIERIVSKESAVFDRIEQTILSLDHPLQFIELIEALAEEQGITSRLLVREKPVGGFQKFQIVAEGSFPRVFQYLRILEFLPYQITFSRVQYEFSPAGDGSFDGRETGQQAVKSKKGTVTARMTLDLAVRAQ